MLHRPALTLLLLCLLFSADSLARRKPEEKSFPHFSALRQDEVNVRTGPGTQYPIEWVYVRRGLPVEVVGEFEGWRRIRDWDGTEGWVHMRMLGGKRALLVHAPAQFLHAAPDEASRALASAEGGASGEILSCPKASSFCLVEIGGLKGWMKKSAFYGVYLDEILGK